MIPFPMNPRDPNYIRDLNIFSKQQGQDAENSKTLTEWKQKASNWAQAGQNAIDEGLQTLAQVMATAPALPQMNVYNDDGTVSHPPFPGVTLPNVHESHSTSIVPVATPENTPLDRTDAILMLLQHVVGDLDGIKADMAAVKAKAGA